MLVYKGMRKHVLCDTETVHNSDDKGQCHININLNSIHNTSTAFKL